MYFIFYIHQKLKSSGDLYRIWCNFQKNIQKMIDNLRAIYTFEVFEFFSIKNIVAVKSLNIEYNVLQLLKINDTLMHYFINKYLFIYLNIKC